MAICADCGFICEWRFARIADLFVNGDLRGLRIYL
jgi:hypothetical protein